MNLERLRWGEWLAAIAALDLVLVTFRAWYKVSGGGAHVTAWDALEQGRILLLVTAVAGIFLLLLRAAEDTRPLPFPLGWFVAAIGFACTVYVAYRLATPPSDNLDADIGLYLGLVSALGVTIGGLLAAREPEAAGSADRTASEVAQDTFTGPSSQQEPLGALVPDSGGTWSPAPPAATTGWSPAAPAAPIPPATPAGGALGGERPIQSGDSVRLTAGSARFPAGTVAEVVEVFSGGALVEVKAADGMAERFEVPESAYERAPAGGAAPAGESWSPAMPAPAREDWGFDESSGATAEAPAGLDEAGAGDEPKAAKVPWWKREIGGGKKKDTAAEIGAAGAVAAGAAAIAAERNGAGEEKPGFFKRMFGGGKAAGEPETATLEAEPTPASDVSGIGQAAESDTAVDEPAAESAVDESPAAVDREPIAAPPEPEPDPVVEPDPPAPEPEPEASAPPEPEAASEPEPAASEPEPVAAPPEPDPVASAPEPTASEPDVVVSQPDPVASEPDPAAPEPDPEPEPAPAPEVDSGTAGAAGAGAAAAAAASAEPDEAAEEQPKPKRKRSSGSRKVPKEALAAAGDEAQPKVGDEVKLKVGGGRFDAGTKGTVVDVFSAGVIVELSDEDGRSERLDLPFEAIGPADA